MTREELETALTIWDNTPAIWDTGLDGLPLDRYIDATDLIAATARKQLAIMPEVCGTCGGSGVAPGNDTAAMGSGTFTYRHCPTCHGSGKVYPQETVEKIAKALYETVASWIALRRTPWPLLTKTEKETFEMQAIAVLDAINGTAPE